MSKISRIRIGSALRRRVLAIGLFLAPSLLAATLPALAQGYGDTSRLLQLMQQNSSTLGGQGNQQNGLPDETVLQPSSSGAAQASSRLEQIMSARAGAKLQQFGYDQFGRGRAVSIPQTGSVQDSYVLGLGDEVVVSLRGQENNEFRVTVDRNGRVLLPRLNPVAAAGRDFGSFRRDIEDAVRRAFVATTAFVSVARVRQINVMVAGEVNAPGQRVVPGLVTAVDLLLTDGIRKTGSLRNIRIQRGSRTFNLDLYSVLTNQGASGNMTLADGDRILVPPLGKTVAVAGLVRQPGIYELPASASSMSARSLLALAGGLEVRGQYRLSALRIAANGNTQMMPLANEGATIGDSEILFVQLGTNQTVNQATLSGGTALAGQYPISSGTKLSDVLKAPGALPPSPYTLFGVIARKDPRTLLRTLLPFTPVAVLSGSEDQPLQSDDIIRVLSVNETRLLTNTVRLYNLRQESRKLAIRNPLLAAQIAAQDASASGQAGRVTGLVPDPANNSASSLSDMQRRDIADLAEMIDPATQQALAAQVQSQQDALAAQQQAYLQQYPQLQLQQQLQEQQARLAELQAQRPVTPAQAAAAATAGAGANAGGDEASTGPRANPLPGPALNFQNADTTNGQIASNREIRNFGDLARQLQVDQLVLVNFLADHQAGLSGAVSGPGVYFVGPNVPLQDLVQAAGGTTNWADESGIELITTAVDTQSGRSDTRRTQLPLRQGMLANYVVRPHDQLRFNQVFTDSSLGAATVQGEVRFSGTYQITRGERLSDLLARAGGLTNTAYPYGTVFLRKSAAAIEQAGYVRAAKDIENGLVTGLTAPGTGRIDPGTFSSLQSFVNELRNTKAIGRVAITADPSVLATKPELDPLLEPGDVVYIPQRPSTITVLGEVMQPGTMPYRSSSTLRDYIELAGGYGAGSDEDNTFVVLPDGTARKVETSWFGFDARANLPPGSTVVVPRDLAPFNLLAVINNVTGTLSQMAVTAASLAVLSKQ